MSNNKMLIDAAHPEETRVVVLRDGRVEEFDYESAARKLLRGNIYLAKVTRVEPSLQAAFVDYGGNRHGFLAFSEIHPDYYQIPVADRELLKQEEAEAEAEAEAAAEARAERRTRQQEERQERRARDAGQRAAKAAAKTGEKATRETDGSTASAAAAGAAARAMAAGKQIEAAMPEGDAVRQELADATPRAPDEDLADAPHQIGLVEDEGAHLDNGASDVERNEDAAARADVEASAAAEDDLADGQTGDEADLDDDDDEDVAGDDGNGESDPVEEVGSEDAMEEVSVRPRRRARQYKIQEVIKRRQVLLVQVVKEERGNKGAALTTYLSLAGRYTVLMPNTGRGGGISRKISNSQDRRRLKAIANELDVPQGMGLIIRTAGASRSKAEIQRDFDYLLRLWESVRELTLESSAPNLVYEEGNLIKRSIRDLYTKEIDEVLVAGAQSHQEAREFMGMLMPSHAKNVVAYDQPEPLFAKYQIERQLNAMFSPYVTLKSGGYIVINQTEALVSVDVNSGKATREFSIEQTALKTNLEAAQELGRQLKLRDLAGLIVIDFIDMEERRNNRAVERKIKDCLKNDRARVQVGRISHFGLLEMSRQRMRTGVLEGSTTQCPHCAGTGTIRSTESVALAVLRALEDALLGNSRHSLTAVTTATVGLYILNHKRAFINEMEDRYGIAITIEANERMQGANFSIEKATSQAISPRRSQSTVVNMETGFEAQPNNGAQASQTGEGTTAAERDSRKPRRRRGGRGTSDSASGEAAGNNNMADGTQNAGLEAKDRDESGPREQPAAAGEEAMGAAADKSRRPRRRGRRGGRRNRERQQSVGEQAAADSQLQPGQPDDQAPRGERANGVVPASASIPGTGSQPDLGDLPALHGAAPEAVSASSNKPAADGRSGGRRRGGRGRAAGTGDSKPVAAKSQSGSQADGAANAESAPASQAPAKSAAAAEPEPPKKPERKGWWQRAFSGD